jgi:hypothetical protein
MPIFGMTLFNDDDARRRCSSSCRRRSWCASITQFLDLANHLNPEIKREVFPFRVAKLRSKLLCESSSEHVDIQPRIDS